MPRKNNRSPLDEGEIARRKVWKHNSYFGHARMMQAQCENIIHSPTTTEAAKETARRIQMLTVLLTQNLKERVDK
jgi:hypothetical protein